MITNQDTGGVAIVPLESISARRQRILDLAQQLFIAAVRTEGLRLTSTEDCDRIARAAFERARQFEDIASSMPEARA